MKPIRRQPPEACDCETIHSLIPAYSLDATDAEETRLVETHLKNCPDAAAELRAYRVLADKLSYSIPLRQAPAHLGDQIMAKIAEETLRPLPSSNGHAPHRETPSTSRKRPLNTKAVPYAAMALALIVLLVSNLYWSNQMAAVQQTQSQMEALLQDHTAVLALIGAGETQRIELQNVEETVGRAVLLCNPDEDVGFVYAEDFPPMPSGDVYQVWLVDDDQRRINAGVFQINDAGEGTLIFQFAEPPRNYDAVEITREPAPGSLQPSPALVMQGAITYS